MVEENLRLAQQTIDRGAKTGFSAPAESADTEGKTVREVEPPTPPFWGVREMSDICLPKIWPHLDLKTLFRLHWEGKGVKDEAWTELQEKEFRLDSRRCNSTPKKPVGSNDASATAISP